MLRAIVGETNPLYHGTLPMVVPSNYTMGDNGAISGIAAFTATFSSGCYMYLPANGIYAGSAAGLYYCIMSSTTAGTVYNNTYTSGVPTAPESPTPFVTTGPGAVVQTSGVILPLLTLTLPAKSLGTNGYALARGRSFGSGASNKRYYMSLGGIDALCTIISTYPSGEYVQRIDMEGDYALNSSINAYVGGVSAAAMGSGVYRSINTDMSSDVNVVFGLYIDDATTSSGGLIELSLFTYPG